MRLDREDLVQRTLSVLEQLSAGPARDGMAFPLGFLAKKVGHPATPIRLSKLMPEIVFQYATAHGAGRLRYRSTSYASSVPKVARVFLNCPAESDERVAPPASAAA